MSALLFVLLVLIPTPFGAFTKKVFAIVEENGAYPPFHTKVSSVIAEALCPAAKELELVTTLYDPHGMVLFVQLIELYCPPPITLSLQLVIALNTPPPIALL